MSSDNLELVFKKFFSERTENLFDRFTGLYRARVEETNDPLLIGRVRVRIPELHNADVRVDDLPWAVPAYPMGGKGSGWWQTLTKGDIVWIQFEKNHPYAPIWVGAADPTRRRFYPLESIHGPSPLSVNSKGEAAGVPDNSNPDYLPLDNRPMSWGIKDRYGTFLMASSVGFFPKEHAIEPAKAGTDAVSRAAFAVSTKEPQPNNPDVKYAVLHTAYGHTMILNDVGYKWPNEFSGDFEADENFEIKRHKYLQKLFNEQEASGRDQRRIEFRTRYGNKFEMRDVGWSTSRTGEYDTSVTVSDNTSTDERWIKLRTKSGMLIQAIDKGNDPVNDVFVNQLLSADKGSDLDNEATEDFDVDARQIRLVTRHGAKLALDDRGSSRTDALNDAATRGNGVLLKSRRGFGLDANDKDLANRLLLYTPSSKVVDLNDRFGYVMVATDTADSIGESFRGTLDNEFATTVALTHDPERTTYHLKLDKQNQYISLKTPEGQGIEIRDAGAPSASFTELIGPDDRGLWMSRDSDTAVWRNKDNSMYVSLDDGQQLILIKNNSGKIQIISQDTVDVISPVAINMSAPSISMLAATSMVFGAAGSVFEFGANGLSTNGDIRAKRLEVVSMYGTHEVIQMPEHPAGFAPPGLVGSPSAPSAPTASDVPIRKPDTSDRNNAPNSGSAGAIPKSTFTG